MNFDDVSARLAELLSLSGQSAPVVLIGLALVVLLPLLILIGWLVRAVSSRHRLEPIKTRAGTTAGIDAAPAENGRSHTIIAPRPRIADAEDADAPEPKRITTQTLRTPRRAGKAQIIVESDGELEPEPAVSAETTDRQRRRRRTGSSVLHANDRGPAYSFPPSDMMRIGREADNDIVLNARTVHRYHAVVQRRPDAGYVVVDLSGDGGNGVYVNGERCYDAQLKDGDRLALGSAKLRFVGG